MLYSLRGEVVIGTCNSFRLFFGCYGVKNYFKENAWWCGKIEKNNNEMSKIKSLIGAVILLSDLGDFLKFFRVIVIASGNQRKQLITIYLLFVLQNLR